MSEFLALGGRTEVIVECTDLPTGYKHLIRKIRYDHRHRVAISLHGICHFNDVGFDTRFIVRAAVLLAPLLIALRQRQDRDRRNSQSLAPTNRT